MLGRVHAIETDGVGDGPGKRTLVFMQGCGLRCAYCHNPETWDRRGGMQMTPEAVLEKVIAAGAQRPDHGVTCTGGEPIIQPEFLIRFFQLCHEHGIHTALDTSGVGPGRFREILEHTDLVLLDVKHVSRDGFREIAGIGYDRFTKFVSALNRAGTPTWVRQVVVPGITDDAGYIDLLAETISNYANVQKVELLPYSTMGISKYKYLGIPYPLGNLPPMQRNKLERMEQRICKKVFGENVIAAG